MTYTAIRVTTTTTTSIVTFAANASVGIPSSVAGSTVYDFAQLFLDTTTNTMTGVQSDGTRVTFEAGVALTIAAA